jgi:hypothetical protein
MRAPRFKVRTLVVVVAFVALVLMVTVQQIQMARMSRQLAALQRQAQTQRFAAERAQYLAELYTAGYLSRRTMARETAKAGAPEGGK